MVFKSDKQRKKVMALLKGGTKSSVNPQVVGRINVNPSTTITVNEQVRERKNLGKALRLLLSDNIGSARFFNKAEIKKHKIPFTDAELDKLDRDLGKIPNKRIEDVVAGDEEDGKLAMRKHPPLRKLDKILGIVFEDII